MKASANTKKNGKAVAVLAFGMFMAVVLGAAGTAYAPPIGNGHARIVSGGAGSVRLFWIDLPQRCSRLVVQLTGGFGNANLSLRRQGTTAWRHSNHAGNHEHIQVINPHRGRWLIYVRGFTPYHHASLVATFHVRPGPTWQHSTIRATPGILHAILSNVRNGRDDDDREERRELRPEDTEVRMTTLQPGKWVKRLRGVAEVPHFYRIIVSREAAVLTFATKDGQGGCQLLVRRDELPTRAEYDHCSAVGGTSQAVVVNDPPAGVYYARLVGDPEFRGVSLMAEMSATDAAVTAGDLRITPLRNHVAAAGLEGEPDSRRYFMMHFAQAPRRLTITTRGGNGQCRLYLRRNALPTPEQFDHRGSGSLFNSTHQTIRLDNDLAAGTYYVMLHGRSGYREVTLLAEAEVAQAAEAMAILTPAGETPMVVGRAYEVTWQVPTGVQMVTIQVSWDAGQSWQQLASLPARTPCFLWYVPADQAVNGDGALLRISENGNSSNAAVRQLSFTQT